MRSLLHFRAIIVRKTKNVANRLNVSRDWRDDGLGHRKDSPRSGKELPTFFRWKMIVETVAREYEQNGRFIHDVEDR